MINRFYASYQKENKRLSNQNLSYSNEKFLIDLIDNGKINKSMDSTTIKTIIQRESKNSISKVSTGKMTAYFKNYKSILSV